jgi:hypothetical protein
MRVKTVVVLLLVGGAGYWIYKTHPTASGFVDELIRPVMRSKTAAKETEHKRIVAESVPAPEGEEAPQEALKKGMTRAEVRDLLGEPERVERLQDERPERLRWTYLRAGRVIVFEDGRVVSIVIR